MQSRGSPQEFPRFRFALLVFGNSPICSDLPSLFSSDLFRFVFRRNQNKSEKPLSADPFRKSPQNGHGFLRFPAITFNHLLRHCKVQQQMEISRNEENLPATSGVCVISLIGGRLTGTNEKNDNLQKASPPPKKNAPQNSRIC